MQSIHSKKGRLLLYFIKPKEKDRWFKGDAELRAKIRRIIRGKPRPGGVEKVFINLCKGLDKIGVKYIVNLPYSEILRDDKVGILGNGKNCLDGYKQQNSIVAGIALMTHPSEWPNLFKEYPVITYLQHSEWAANVYKPFFGNESCKIWPVGVDTDYWKPDLSKNKNFDVLIYNKIRWNKNHLYKELRDPILEYLKRNNFNYKEIVYGNYSEMEYHNLLQQSNAMIFLCEHESQGIACCEALSMNVPVLAWDNGFCLDPNRFLWGSPKIPATSVPIFNHNCGERFQSIELFESKANIFFKKLQIKEYNPREFILQNITLEKSATKFLEFIYNIN